MSPHTPSVGYVGVTELAIARSELNPSMVGEAGDTAGCVKKRIKSQQHRKRSQRRARYDSRPSTSIIDKKRHSSAASEDKKSLILTSGIERPATTRSSNITPEQDMSCRARENLEQMGRLTPRSPDADCVSSLDDDINTDDDHLPVSTSGASLEMRGTTPTQFPLSDITMNSVSEDEHGHARKASSLRIEIPHPPHDWWNWLEIPSSPSGSDGGHSSEASSEPLISSQKPGLRKGRRGRPLGSKNKKTMRRERRQKMIEVRGRPKTTSRCSLVR